MCSHMTERFILTGEPDREIQSARCGRGGTHGDQTAAAGYLVASTSQGFRRVLTDDVVRRRTCCRIYNSFHFQHFNRKSCPPMKGRSVGSSLKVVSGFPDGGSLTEGA